MVRVGRRFEPSVTAIGAGSTVRFVNHDRTYHSVFSRSPARRFDTGLFSPGAERSVRFGRVGIVEIHCGIDDAVAWVVVLPYSGFTVTDARGEFSLGGLKPGAWTVKAWHPAWGTANTQVELKGRTSGLTMRLSGEAPPSGELP